MQARAISSLFDKTRLLITEWNPPVPTGLTPLTGNSMQVEVLPRTLGGRLHKILLLVWLPLHLPRIWKEIRRADIIHTPVPGDVGGIGLLLALIQRKRIFVRHCGTWGEPVTISDRILLWLLEKIADEKRVIVFATGGAETPPSRKNPHIQWIFSTTLTQRELEETPRAQAWQRGQVLRLVTVARLSEGKNIQSLIRALPALLKAIPNLHLDILGDGEFRPILEHETSTLQLSNHITFHGNVNHEGVLQTLSRSHLFVFPTRTKEGFPKSVLEALACGLPVIATRVSVIPQLLQNGCGILLDETTPKAVTDAVLEITSNVEEMNQRREFARQAAQGYTLEAWAEAIGTRLRAAWGELKT
jgi:glycosyltransferase involved in cell wall biosynthesis